MRLLAIIIASAAVLSGCSEFVGPHPPADALNFPVGIAVHPNGRYLYVANSNFDARYRTDVGGTITVLDARTLEVLPDQTLRIGSFAGAVALNGGRSGVDVPDRLYVTTRADDSVVALTVSPDGATIRCPNAARGASDALDCRIHDMPHDPFALAMVERHPSIADDRDLFAVAGLGGSVAFVSLSGTDDRLDVADALAESQVVVSGASALRWFPQTAEAWVAGRFSRRIRGVAAVHRTDPESGEPAVDGSIAAVVVTNETFVPSTMDRAEVRDIVFSADGSRAYVSVNNPGAILVLDMTLDDDGVARATVLDRWDIDGAPAQMILVEEAGRQLVYTALAADEALAVIDVEAGVPIDFVPLEGLAYGLAWHPETGRVYVTLFDTHAVAAIDIDPGSPTHRQVVGVSR